MASKTEAPAATPETADATAAPKKSGGLMGTLIPLLAVVVLAPAVSWAVAQFVLIPQLRKELTAAASEAPAPEAEHAAAAHEGGGKEAKGGHGKKGEAAGAGNTYTFENVVVNLAGTMGTRYLKVTFMVTGPDQSLRGQFEANRPKLVDVTLNVLSSLSLADLEEAGAKNIIREKLVGAYNQALGKKVAEQIYFSDFVVQ